MMRFVHALNAILLSTTTAALLIVWGRLPESLPTHFGLDGAPNAWSPKHAAITLLFALPWGLSALFYAVGLLIGRGTIPASTLNVPHKSTFRRLSAKQQTDVARAVGDLLFLLAAGTNLLLAICEASIVGVAMGWLRVLPDWAFWPGLALVVLIGGLGTAKLSRQILALADERGTSSDE